MQQGAFLYHTYMCAAYFYESYGGDPYWNMAFDEWLLVRTLKQPGLLFLRLYTWHPGAITFGYNQRQETALDFGRLGDTPVIRRVTGGRALYHDPSEYTYAVAANVDQSTSEALSSGLSKSSEAISMALAAFLGRLNIRADYVRASAPGHNRPEIFHKAPCFASAARHELMSAGRKVVASAQKRLGSCFLQHGSIKLYGVASHPALGDLKASAATLQSIKPESFTRTAAIFKQVVGESLNIDFTEVTPSEEELGEINQRADLVKKNHLGKRLIIAQKRRGESL